GITTEAALFNHFVKFGIFEGRACCEGFNVAAYKSSYSDLQAAFGDDVVAYYVHYETFGKTEKRALVTVEAAAAAGVTVKSAADGAVVAAGAAKPAAGGAASSSGSAASTETKTNEGAAGIGKVSNVDEDADEVKLNASVDYDSVAKLFYDYNKGIKENKTKQVAMGYVQVGANYYSLMPTTSALKENYVKIDKDKYYLNTVENQATKTTVVTGHAGLDASYWVLNNGEYHHIDKANLAYKDASGNAWNLKAGYDAVNIWNTWYFFKTTGDTLGTKYNYADTTRKLETGAFATVRRASQPAYAANNWADGADGHTVYVHDTAYAGNLALATETLEPTGNAYLVEAVPVDNTFIIFKHGAWTTAAGGTNATSQKGTVGVAANTYQLVSMATACNFDDVNWAIIDGTNTVISKNNVMSVADAKKKEHYDSSKYKMVGDTYDGYVTDLMKFYPIVNRATALKDGYTYYGEDYKITTYDLANDGNINTVKKTTGVRWVATAPDDGYVYYKNAADATEALVSRGAAPTVGVLDSVSNFYYGKVYVEDAVDYSDHSKFTAKFDTSVGRYYYVK
nr:hypothetical protein [Lachnospiraceae bacterium]